MEAYERKIFYQDKKVAEAYFSKRFCDPKGKRQHRATLSALTAALDSMPDVKSVLDMPCGTGRFTDLLLDRGYVYSGADVSFEMLRVLTGDVRKRETTPTLVRCDGERLPFKDGAFDCVVCMRFLNLVPEDVRGRILREMRRVSRKWLVVQSHLLKSRGFVLFLKVLLRKWFGGDLKKYQLAGEIARAGWTETARFRVKRTGHCVGVYQRSGE